MSLITIRRALLLFVSLCAAGGHAQAPAPQAAASPAQFAEWRAQIRKALFIPTPLPALKAQNYGTFAAAEGVIAERVTYATEYGMRVPAIVYRPAHPLAKRLPALVVVNGHSGDKSSWYAWYTGILYARAGAVVVTYDPIGEGERNTTHKSAAREHDQVIDSPELHGRMGARMGGLMVTDVLQATAYLASRKDVDRERIAVLGYSMGSFIATIAGALAGGDQAPRFHALVLSGGGDLDGPGGYWDQSRPMCQALPYKALSFLPDRGPDLFALNAGRGSTLILNGADDRVVDIPHHGPDFFLDLRIASITTSGSGQNSFETIFFPDVGHRPSWITRPAALWLQRQLNFPAWDEARINALPEQKISVWAANNHVALDAKALAEASEGGTPALLTDVPAPPDMQLNALSEEQWKRLRIRFVYETWVTRALADEGIRGSAAGLLSGTLH